MPRLTMDKSSGNLTWALSNMGLSELFKPGYAQLYDVSDYKWLAVSDVIHKTYLDIKESSSNSADRGRAFDDPMMASGSTLNSMNMKHPSQQQQHTNSYFANPFNTMQLNKQPQQSPVPYISHPLQQHRPQQHHFHHHSQQPINPFKQQYNQQNSQFHLNPPASTLIPQASQPQATISTNAPISKPPVAAVSGSTNNDVISVTFDRPFLYFVMDNISGLVLVMGKAGAPSREMASFGTYRLPI